MTTATAKRVTRGERLAIWVIFGIAGGLLPFIFGYFQDHQNGPKSHVLNSLISGGELYIAAAGIAAATIGELLKAKQASAIRWLNIGIATMLLAVCSFLFGDAKSSSAVPEQVRSTSVLILAIVVGSSFVAALQTGA